MVRLGHETSRLPTGREQRMKMKRTIVIALIAAIVAIANDRFANLETVMDYPGGKIHKFRDGLVICYVVENRSGLDVPASISCVK